MDMDNWLLTATSSDLNSSEVELSMAFCNNFLISKLSAALVNVNEYRGSSSSRSSSYAWAMRKHTCIKLLGVTKMGWYLLSVTLGGRGIEEGFFRTVHRYLSRFCKSLITFSALLSWWQEEVAKTGSCAGSWRSWSASVASVAGIQVRNHLLSHVDDEILPESSKLYS